MLNIIKKEEPNFFQEFKNKYSPRNWGEYQNIQKENNINIKEELKKYMLLNEQNFSCCYCEKTINKNTSHIEHIKSKSKFPKEFQDYTNLVVSCMSNTSCGHYKDEKGKTKYPNYYNKFINPVIENPECYFCYDLKTGELILKDGIKKEMKEKGKLTIGVLNLNEKSLVSARKNYLFNLMNCIEQPETFEFFTEFPTMVKFLKDEFNV